MYNDSIIINLLSKSMENNKKSPYSNRKIRQWSPTLFTPTNGQLASSINRLTQEFLQEIFNVHSKDLPKYIEMAKKDPMVRACIELKCLRASTALGKYQHKNNQYEEWVNSNWDTMKGSLRHKVGRLASAAPLGFSVAEIVFDNNCPGFRNQWRLKDIVILDPTRVSFEGKKGELDFVVYLDGDGSKRKIPYGKCIHVSNGFGSCFLQDDDVYGDPESKTAYQYYKAKQAILSEMMVAAKNNATGVWVGKVDSNVTVEVIDSMGNVKTDVNNNPLTEPAGAGLLRQMLNLENNSVIVTDKDNDIMPLSTQTSEQFWQLVINLLDQSIRRAYGIPDLIFNEGSSSIQFGSIGKQHKSILDAQIESILLQIQDQIIEKIIKPLLVFNFGEVRDFGKFEADTILDPDTQSSRVQNLITAMTSNLISPQNLAATNTLAELLGLPSLSQEQQQEEIRKQLMKSYLDGLVIQGIPPTPEGIMQAANQSMQTPQETDSNQSPDQEDPNQ